MVVRSEERLFFKRVDFFYLGVYLRLFIERVLRIHYNIVKIYDEMRLYVCVTGNICQSRRRY